MAAGASEGGAGGEGAPEKYDFKVPEGYEIPDETMGKVDGLFREANLSNGQAQKFVDFYEEQTKEAMAAPYELWAGTQQKWVDEMKADRELGGTNLNRTLSSISRFINAMPNANAFKEALNYTGAGNHPDIIRGLYAMSKAHTESRAPVTGKPAGQSDGRPSGPGARALYPSLPTVR